MKILLHRSSFAFTMRPQKSSNNTQKFCVLLEFTSTQNFWVFLAYTRKVILGYQRRHI